MLSNIREDYFNPTYRSSKSEAASDANAGSASSSSSAQVSSSALVTASLSGGPVTNSPLPVDIQNVVFDYLLMAEPSVKSPAVLTSAKEEASSSQSSSAVTEAAAAAVTPARVPSLDDVVVDADENENAAASTSTTSTSTMNTHLTTSTVVNMANSTSAAAATCNTTDHDTKHIAPNDTPVSRTQCGRYATGLNTPGLSFFDTASLAVAAHNLLWRKEVDKTLAFLKNNPELLFKVVEIEDPYGQKVRGTILQIVAAAGDRNPRALKAGEKDCGLVERLYECFPAGQKSKYYEQLNDWFNQYNVNLTSAKKIHGPLKKETVYVKADQYQRMEPYVRAMETLCQELKDLKIPATASFDELLKSRIAEKFRRAIATPDPSVVTSGLIFDYQLFLKFFEIWQRNINDADPTGTRSLGPYYGLKSDLFATIVYLALLKRTPRCDWGTFKAGIADVVEGRKLPDDIDFSKGIPADFKGFGESFFFGLSGYRYEARDSAGAVGRAGAIFRSLWQAKTSAVELRNTNRSEFMPRVGNRADAS